VSDKSACFDVKVYLTKEEWDNKVPSQEIDAFEEIEDAIEEAQLWPEAYQVIVVASGDDTYDAGEYVYALNLLPG
jgi:hypothetical protein